LAGHVTSLLYRDIPQTSDITIIAERREFRLHKFILAARSPYFAKKLALAPETTTWRVPQAIPTASLELAIQALYLNDSLDLHEDVQVLEGLDKICKTLEIGDILEMVLETDRRIARQHRSKEIERARGQLSSWFEKMIIGNTVKVDSNKADDIKWDRQNSIFADVLLCADDPDSTETSADSPTAITSETSLSFTGIPVDLVPPQEPHSTQKKIVTLFPAHRAMLLRSEFFLAMFSSSFREAQRSEHLPVIHLDCSPAVLRVILNYMYTEHLNFGLDVAINVLFTADALFIEKLKVKAAMIISTLGNGAASIVEAENPRGETSVEDVIDIYDVVRAGWDTRVHRLEEFGARYIAYRLERYIDEPEFKELVRESAARITQRQETDTVEIIDDIRYYLSDRFRLRFEDIGLDEMTEDMPEGQASADVPKADNVEGDVAHSQSISEEGDRQLAEKMGKMELETSSGGPDVGQQVVIRTLDGKIAGDEFVQDALNYQILLGKIDTLLEELKLDA
jgi:ankyrin repeat/BTB/POZ domain-containing protein 1